MFQDHRDKSTLEAIVLQREIALNHCIAGLRAIKKFSFYESSEAHSFLATKAICGPPETLESRTNKWVLCKMCRHTLYSTVLILFYIILFYIILH